MDRPESNKRKPGMSHEAAAGELQDKLEALVQRCLDLHDDMDLDAVRIWKEKDGDRRAIGYLPIYIPVEIIHAVGALPVGIIGGGNRIDVIRGDAYFQSYICHLPRSVVEMGLSGRLAALDGMLFPAICDVVRNLSGIWQILFPDTLVQFVDFPQNFSPEVGGRFYVKELRRLSDAVSELTGIAFDPERLRRSIALYNTNRRLIRSLHAARAATPDLVPTHEAYLLQRAGHLLPVEEHNELLARYLELAGQRPRTARDNARIVIVGAFCEQPPLALIRGLELAGCDVVDDDLLLGNRLLSADVGTEGDPLEELTDTYLHHTLPCSSIYEGNGSRGEALVERVRRLEADGVVFAAPSFCDPALLDRPLYQKTLEKEGIPHTSFKYAENTGQLAAIREQVGTFAESVRLWGDASAVRVGKERR